MFSQTDSEFYLVNFSTSFTACNISFWLKFTSDFFLRWVNRKDPEGKNIFSGGFLGLDNIGKLIALRLKLSCILLEYSDGFVGVFDRSKPLPTGGHLEQVRNNIISYITVIVTGTSITCQMDRSVSFHSF